MFSSKGVEAMKRAVLVLGFVGLSGLVVFAYGEGLSTVFPLYASAGMTCYPVTDGYSVAAVNSTRDDILATLVKKDASGHDVSVCFLRPPAADPNWVSIAPVPSVPAPPQAVTCPGYPTAPFPGATCYSDGGWR